MNNLFVLLLICAFSFRACGQSNVYYDDTKLLDDAIRSNPSNKKELDKLIKYTKSPEYWYRYYSYCFLGNLAVQNVGGCRKALMPILTTAVNDPDRDIRTDAINAFAGMGANEVESILPQLLTNANENVDNSLCFASLAAISKVESSKALDKCVPVLLQLAMRPPFGELADDIPCTKEASLDAILMLAKSNPDRIVPEIEKRLIDELVPLIDSGVDCELVCSSIELLAKIRTKAVIEKITPHLIGVVLRPLPLGTSEDSDSLRKKGFEALDELATRSPGAVVHEIEKHLDEGELSVRKQMATILLRVDPENTGAQRIIKTGK